MSMCKRLNTSNSFNAKIELLLLSINFQNKHKESKAQNYFLTEMPNYSYLLSFVKKKNNIQCLNVIFEYILCSVSGQIWIQKKLNPICFLLNKKQFFCQVVKDFLNICVFLFLWRGSKKFVKHCID